ncbi:MAG: ATP-binding protein [Actinomycetota bacterium]
MVSTLARARIRLPGKLAGMFLLASGILTIVTLPLAAADLNVPGTAAVGVAAIALGVLAWVLPWDRWPRSATLALVPPAFVLIALGNLFGGSDVHLYGIFFVLAFVWLGVAHPPRSSLMAAPLAAIAYVVPLFFLPGDIASGVGSAIVTVGVCVLVGETLAWSRRRVSETERLLKAEHLQTEQFKELDEMKRTVLHAVSHELRTPVSSILGYSVTLERQGEDLGSPQRQEIATRMAFQSRKLLQMLEDLLDLDRIDQGLLEPKREPVDVGSLTARVVRELDVLRGRDVRMQILPIVESVDAVKVERIVTNLLTNTARHTPLDSVIWVRVVPADGGAEVAVEDNGPGVPAELREAVFEPFRRADYAEGSSGYGIGLSIVARFAELHGGRAWVEDRPGGGASFRVVLPGPPAMALGA